MLATMKYFLPISLLLALFLLPGCTSESTDKAEQPTTQASDASGLSQSELEKGIGPITNVNLEAINSDLASEGETIFNTKCVACHRFDQRYVGPPLNDILSKRTPEFIMNMMLNPQEMVEKHPDVKEMLATYMTPMPNQNLTEQDARAVLEYIRQETAKTSG